MPSYNIANNSTNNTMQLKTFDEFCFCRLWSTGGGGVAGSLYSSLLDYSKSYSPFPAPTKSNSTNNNNHNSSTIDSGNSGTILVELSGELVEGISVVRCVLQVGEEALEPSLFGMLWRATAANLNSYIFEKIVSHLHFTQNRGKCFILQYVESILGNVLTTRFRDIQVVLCSLSAICSDCFLYLNFTQPIQKITSKSKSQHNACWQDIVCSPHKNIECC